MVGACRSYGDDEKFTIKKVVGKPEGQRPLERHIYRWEDNIKQILRKMGWEGGY
jgi:hypothetical protein